MYKKVNSSKTLKLGLQICFILCIVLLETIQMSRSFFLLLACCLNSNEHVLCTLSL
jgi:hypothetical protein